jgi:hypothetical protein
MVECADYADAFGVRCPDGEAHARYAGDGERVRAEKAMGVIVVAAREPGQVGRVEL